MILWCSGSEIDIFELVDKQRREEEMVIPEIFTFIVFILICRFDTIFNNITQFFLLKTAVKICR